MKKINLKTSHTSFSIIFAASLYVISNSVNIDKISKWFLSGGSINYIAFGAYLIIGFAVFITFFLLLAHKWTTKPVAIFIVILSGAATYFIAKYNVAIDRSMIMNTLNTDITESTSLLSVQMLPYLFFLIILPVLVILKVEITYKKPLRHLFSSLKVIVVSLVIAISLSYLNFKSISQAVNISNKYAVHTLVPVNVIRSSLSALSKSLEPYFKQMKKKIEVTASIKSEEDLVVVLAVGESTRQKSVSLYGYDRKNTTPMLSQQKDLHILNGIATAGSTLYALPKILEKNDIKLAAVTSKVGIDTACYVNFSLYGNCDPVEEIKVNNCGHDGDCYDEDLLPLLENNLASYQSGYRFVVLHMGGGSHGPRYNDRFPPEFNIFQPTCDDADVINQCSVEELYNSFDNTVLYLDFVLSSIIDELEDSKVPYVLIYLSDHGESLLEEGRIFHGMPPGVALPPEQAQIPLLVKSSVPIEVLKRKEYSQPDVFDTILSLFSIESEQFSENNSFIKKLARAKQDTSSEIEAVSASEMTADK